MKKVYIKMMLALLCASLLSVSSLSAQNLLANPGFESGVVEPWFGDNGNIVTIIQEAAEGTYAARGNAAQNVELTEGVEYELRCKAKIVTAGAEEKVWIGVRGPSALVQNSEIFETDWEDMAIDFTAPETGTHKIWIWGQGTSTYESDGWTLVVKGTTSIREEAKAHIQVLSGTNGVTINLDNVSPNANIMVRDITGKDLFQLTSTQAQYFISQSEFPASGVYLVSVQTDAYNLTEKVLVNLN